jgi:hypothetical protein
MNDDELKHALQQWKAPDAPASLERKVLGELPAEAWWRWLLTGSVRVPVPALIAAAVFVVAFYAVRTNRTPISCASNVGAMKYVAMVVCDVPSQRLKNLEESI